MNYGTSLLGIQRRTLRLRNLCTERIIVTGLLFAAGRRNCIWVPGRGERFFSHLKPPPDVLWSPVSLLLNRYQTRFPSGKAVGA